MALPVLEFAMNAIEMTYDGWEGTKTYSSSAGPLIRIGEAPHPLREALNKFMEGQTRPVISGHDDYIYLWDYENFLNGLARRATFFD